MTTEDDKPVRRKRKQFDPPPKRRFLSGNSALLYMQPAGTTPPAFGQRVRDKYRGPSLRPAPLKA